MSKTLAERLWTARTVGGLVPRAAADDLRDDAEAYAVQREIEAHAGFRRAGWKVGATSDMAQELLDVTGPASAPMFEPHCLQSPAEVAIFEGQGASVECEFAFRFGRPLPSRTDEYSRDQVLDAVEALLPSIEVVACRFEGGFLGMDGTRLIADMTGNLAWVWGTGTDDWRGRDLATHRIVLSKNGERVTEGTGAQVLGDPLNVLIWTAHHLSRQGEGIAAGDVVSTGTCTGLTAVIPGDAVLADFGDLGSVEVRFRAGVGDSAGI